ncbi:MAG: hypothetical protein QGH25_17175 [Candidatus Latescibacteria bacterium]|nr:hypothetical protein [Candidatus Latescibacterota bacterium]
MKSLLTALACLLLPSLPATAADRSARAVQLAVDVRYYYGHWQWGDFNMTPRAGMAGPDLRLEFQGGRLSVGTTYLSGNFAAVGAVALDDPLFHSRKNFDLVDNREEFSIDLEYRPVRYAGLVLMYRLGQYDLSSTVDLNSDQRLYGRGREQATNEARGWGVGLRAKLPLRRSLVFSGEFIYFASVAAEAAGTYQYQMLYNNSGLDERWFGRSDLRGFKGRGELTYSLKTVPISLAAGYFYQLLVDRDAARTGWVEAYLAGQTQGRNWLDDRFRGFTARAGFSF